MSAARQGLGQRPAVPSLPELGERIAERWLRGRGWRVVQRRFRSGPRDIDLVVERDGVVAFVEVTVRSGDRFGGPVEAVNSQRQNELASAARVWIDRHGRGNDVYRFDVIGVLVAGARVRVRHVPNAFVLHLSA
jgi:putative endonuclease